MAPRRASRSRSEGSVRARAYPAPAGSTAAKPDQSAPGLNTPSDHGRFNTQRDHHSTDGDAERGTRPAHPAASTLASTRHNASSGRGRRRRASNGDRDRRRRGRGPAPLTSTWALGPSERSEPARARQTARRPTASRRRRRGRPAPVAERVVRQRDGRVRDERRDAGPHAADGRGEPPDADEPDRAMARGRAACGAAPSWPNAGIAPRPTSANAVGAAAVVPSPIERHPAPNERMRSAADEGSGASCPIAGTPCVMQLAAAEQKEGDGDHPGEQRGAPRPGHQTSPATVRPTAAAAANRSSEAGRRITARTCALPLVLQPANLVVGDEPDALEVSAATADLAVVREVPRPCADRVLRSARGDR